MKESLAHHLRTILRLVSRTLLRVASRLTGHLFRVVPRRARFRLARRIAVSLGNVHRQTRLYRRRPSPLDGYREDALRMLIRAMTATGVAYDPEAVVVGGDLLPSGGVVILTGHFLTNGVLGRLIFDRGELWCVIAAEIEDRYYPGLRVQYETIFAGPASLVRARARLRQGIKVLGLVDSSAAGDRRLPVATAIGQRYISPALAALAVNMDVPILFAASAFDDRNRFVVTIERPKSSDAARIAEEFCEFYTERAAAIRR